MNETLVYSLLQGIQREDPRIHDLIRELIRTIQEHNNVLFPEAPLETSEQESIGGVAAPLSFTYTLILEGIKFEWTRPSGVSFFEIRKGLNWEVGIRQLVTSSLSAVLEPQLAGTHEYWIKSIDEDGAYSVDAIGLDVFIPEIGGIAIQGRVIDNTVLLTWTIPTSAFRIVRFLIGKNGVQVGALLGTFTTIFEQTAGVYEYSVQAIDLAGNLSPIATISLLVNQPSDYVLEDIQNSDLDGTRTNVYRDSLLPSLLANVNLTETWQSHFIANSFDTIQEQIDAGLPYYLQPTMLNGEYAEIFDYGAVFDTIIATADWNFNEIVPAMLVEPFISYSLDNITYSTELPGTQIFAPSLRYVKLRLEFTALN